MADEYYEQKSRYYMPKKKKKEGGKLERFVIHPMMRVVGVKDHKKERLTA